ncbi:hypothetical protein [Brevibacillus daliensis]|uniref:hypothetical protein n=1 Tax=Brevibacillus daliensis TaxID=2892995 RepID=UPI001E2F5ED6|nr:hypothetical protein [Brevibacillus daliensis]
MFLSKCKKLVLTVFMFALVISGQSFAFAEDEYSENLIPMMSSNSSTEGTASSSSVWSSGHQPYKAFDYVNSNVGWVTAAGYPNGWLAYEFPNETIVNKYTIRAIPNSVSSNKHKESPKTWTFEGWDGTAWVVLDQQSNVSDWQEDIKKEFTFTNNNSYKNYRINITENNSNGAAPYYVGIGEMEMMNKISSTPDPNPKPDPEPKPTGDRALVVINMVSGATKEYDMSANEVVKFVEWYEGRISRSGNEAYMIAKDFNVGPFASRKEFISYSHIESFEIKEYSK